MLSGFVDSEKGVNKTEQITQSVKGVRDVMII
jgi:osmotically-inducible protein OsmY